MARPILVFKRHQVLELQVRRLAVGFPKPMQQFSTHDA